MYNRALGVVHHAAMLNDAARRNDPFCSAIKNAVYRGARVLDVGAGSGILSIEAACAGAGEVHSVEYYPILELAECIARECGMFDRIKFFQCSSYKHSLAEKYDVIISETLGPIGVEENIVEIMYDARKRLSHDLTSFVPKDLSIYAVPIKSPTMKKEWNDVLSAYHRSYDVDSQSIEVNEWLGESLSSVPISVNADDVSVAGERKLLKRYELGDDSISQFSSTAEWSLSGEEAWAGIALYFESELCKGEGITVSTSPELPRSHWGLYVCYLPPLHISDKSMLRLNVSYDKSRQWHCSFQSEVGNE